MRSERCVAETATLGRLLLASCAFFSGTSFLFLCESRCATNGAVLIPTIFTGVLVAVAVSSFGYYCYLARTSQRALSAAFSIAVPVFRVRVADTLISDDWVKTRANQTGKFVIGGYVSDCALDLIFIGRFDDRRLMYAGSIRAGLVTGARQSLISELHRLHAARCPFANLPERTRGRWDEGITADRMELCRWLKPRLVARIEFLKWTPRDDDGIRALWRFVRRDNFCHTERPRLLLRAHRL